MSKSRQSRDASPAREAAILVRSLGLRLPPGHQISEHAHEWAQAVYAVRGVMKVQIDAMQWIVPPMRCLWVPPSVAHRIETLAETWVRTIYVRPDLAPGVSPSIRILEVSPLLRELILEVIRLGPLFETSKLHHAITTLLLSLLAESRELGLALPLPVDPRARRIAERTLREPGADRSLADLARASGASPRTAERLFLEETGLSFGRWRQQARLQFGVRRLAEGADVTRVALECGYDSVSAFVTMFKRALGTTPGRYLGKP